MKDINLLIEKLSEPNISQTERANLISKIDMMLGAKNQELNIRYNEYINDNRNFQDSINKFVIKLKEYNKSVLEQTNN